MRKCRFAKCDMARNMANVDCHAIFDKIFFLQNPLAMTWILDNSVLDFRIYTRRGQRGLGK
ncbi:hypothetical protein [Helicobacter sp. T3_23-1056]